MARMMSSISSGRTVEREKRSRAAAVQRSLVNSLGLPYPMSPRQANYPPMESTAAKSSSFNLHAAARLALRKYGFEPDFPADAEKQLAAIPPGPPPGPAPARDLRNLVWSSIDDDQSRDLDQIEVAEPANGAIRVRVGIADVDVLVPRGTPLRCPCRPQHDDGLHRRRDVSNAAALVVDRSNIAVARTGPSGDRDRIHRGRGWDDHRRRYLSGDGEKPGQARLRWRWRRGLPGRAPPQRLSARPLRWRTSSTCRTRRPSDCSPLGPCMGRWFSRQSRPHRSSTAMMVTGFQVVNPGAARDLIENFMVAANGVVARFLEAHKRTWMQRVVRTPQRWPRIVELARGLGTTLPADPDGLALAAFLKARLAADPAHFPDLSLSVIKLMGHGEYVIQPPGAPPIGHFGLAVEDYTHGTAPNRRYADLITQRLIKATIAGAPAPYSDAELTTIAAHCTDQEDKARRATRLVRKQAAAVMLASHIGETFDSIVTGVTH